MTDEATTVKARSNSYTAFVFVTFIALATALSLVVVLLDRDYQYLDKRFGEGKTEETAKSYFFDQLDEADEAETADPLEKYIVAPLKVEYEKAKK
jgi:hypothetical protein